MKKFLMMVVVAVMAAFSYFAEAANYTESQLEGSINELSSQLPMRIDDSLVWTTANYDGNYVNFTFKFDENIITADQLDMMKAPMKTAILDALFSDPDSLNMLDILTTLNKGLNITFVGSRSGKKVPIKVTPSELKKL